MVLLRSVGGFFAISLVSQAFAIVLPNQEDFIGPQLTKAPPSIESMKDYRIPESVRMFHFAPVPMTPEESAKMSSELLESFMKLCKMQNKFAKQARKEALKKPPQRP